MVLPRSAFSQDAGAEARDEEEAAESDSSAGRSDAARAESAADAAESEAAPPRSPAPATAPGGRSAAARIEPARVALGASFTYVLTVRRLGDDRVQLWPAGTNPFAPFKPRGEIRSGTREEGLVVAESFSVELVALDPSATEVPAVAVSVLSADGRVYEMTASAISVEVADPTANEPLADVKAHGDKGADGRTQPIRPYVIWVRDWTTAIVLAIVFGTLVVALAAVLLTRWYLRRRAAPGPAGPPEPPAYPSARTRLAKLRAPGLYGQMGAKAFHVEIVETVKEYLGRRHRIDALEMTSEELLDVVQRVPMGSVTRFEMEMFLSSCDIVKFAKGEPSEAEGLDALSQAERIVDTVEMAVTEIEVRKAAEAAVAAAAAESSGATGGPGGGA